MWYSSGTVSVDNGSPSVVGVGTDFLANVRVGNGTALRLTHRIDVYGFD